MVGSKTDARLVKRLLPLYVAVFFQGFVLWYAIEKLFITQIGFDSAQIGIMAAGYSAIMLLVETPSGILADRWSRKGVLILASIALAISSLVCGLSNSIPMYLVGAGLWGAFFALYSGMYDSIVYDTLLEEGHSTEKYQRYYGRVKIVDSVALASGSLIGGFIGAQFGLTDAYFLTVPMAFASIGALLIFKEPKLHRKHAVLSIRQHVFDTFGAVMQKGQLMFILVLSVTLAILSHGLFEFNQLWWIALSMPVILFGVANALNFTAIGLGGYVAGRLGLHRRNVMLAAIFVMTIVSVGLVVLRIAPLIVLCQVVLGIGIVGLAVVFNRLLHDSLSSRVRAGASSAVSTITRLIIIPFSLLFGFLSNEFSVFAASWVFVVMLAFCAVVIVKMFAGQKLVPSPAPVGVSPKEA